MNHNLEKDQSIPTRWPSVLAKLEAARPLLLKTGAVVARRRPGRATVWVVRYKAVESGRVRRKTIYLGDAAMAERARTLITSWRDQVRTPAERLQGDILKLGDIQGELAGLSGGARKRLRATVMQDLNNPCKVVAMALGAFPVGDPAIRDGRRGGRPAKSRLW